MKLEWKGDGIDEVGYLDNKLAIRIDPKYYRPAEVETLLGDPSKAKKELHWSPSISFDELVKEMVTSDFHALQKNKG
jgi:GDPmannose 4,6-dehydratase